jgi:sigma-B regulation protein RsbU (phosphoserine phosphatase)
VGLAYQQEADERLHQLMELIAQINSSQDLNELLASIMEAAKTMMDSEASSLMLLSEDRSHLEVTMPTGPATAEISGKKLPADKGIGGWVAQYNEPLVVNNPEEDERFLGDITEQGFKTRNLVCVPLSNRKGEVVGVLQAINRNGGQPFEKEGLTLFGALAHQAAIAIEQARLQEQAIQKERYEQQLEMARSIQTGFWPDEIPEMDGYRIVGTSIPAYHVGGDYYDFIPTNKDQNWGLVVADVTGKGTPAALLMATTRAALRAQVENQHSPSENINLLNQTLFKDTPIDKFVTLFYGELNRQEHSFTYVNAGHNPPLTWHPDTQEIEELQVSGTMLGIIDDQRYQSDVLELEPGQKLVIYSDGVTEANNSEGQMYGEQRLKEFLLKHGDVKAQDLLEQLLSEIEIFQGDQSQSDDITVIVIERES